MSGFSSLRFGDRFAARFGFAADFPTRMCLKQRLDSAPHKIVIVGNQNTKGLHHDVLHYGKGFSPADNTKNYFRLQMRPQDSRQHGMASLRATIRN
jgi:hypothetical protein